MPSWRKPVDLDQLLDVLHRPFCCARSARRARRRARRTRRTVRAAHKVSPEVSPEAPAETLDAMERAVILRTVRAVKGDLAAAARTLGVGVAFLTERLRRYRGAP
jgi:transcriptional regulator with GAF, ATPase, and Fis domain